MPLRDIRKLRRKVNLRKQSIGMYKNSLREPLTPTLACGGFAPRPRDSDPKHGSDGADDSAREGTTAPLKIEMQVRPSDEQEGRHPASKIDGIPTESGRA